MHELPNIMHRKPNRLLPFPIVNDHILKITSVIKGMRGFEVFRFWDVEGITDGVDSGEVN